MSHTHQGAGLYPPGSLGVEGVDEAAGVMVSLPVLMLGLFVPALIQDVGVAIPG